MNTLTPTTDQSKAKTKDFMRVLEHYINGDDVFSQQKGFSLWSKITEVGFMRHQWDTRNENYKVIINNEVVLEIGEEFDDSRTQKEILSSERNAIFQAQELLGLAEQKTWTHYCIEEGGLMFIKQGESCHVCSEYFVPSLSVL